MRGCGSSPVIRPGHAVSETAVAEDIFRVPGVVAEREVPGRGMAVERDVHPRHQLGRREGLDDVVGRLVPATEVGGEILTGLDGAYAPSLGSDR